MSTTNQLTKINFDEETVIYHDSSNSMDTLFSAIRNAFAHGSYQLKTYNKTRYYCFENRQTGNKNYFDYPYNQEEETAMICYLKGLKATTEFTKSQKSGRGMNDEYPQ